MPGNFILTKFIVKIPAMLFPVVLLLLIISKGASASDYYWVNGSGNWSDSTHIHWATTSGGTTFQIQVPTSNDNVFFDVNSFTSAGQTVTINVTQVSCNNMDWRGVTNKPTLTATEPTNELNISGSLSFVPAMTVSNIGPVNFIATTTGQTVTSAGNSFSNTVTFNGIGGGWTLQDSMATNYYGIVLSNGSLNTNGQTVTTNSFRSASGTTRSLTAGASVFNINNVETAWYVTPVGMTMSAGSSVINLTDNDFSWSPTFTGGGFTYNILNFTGPLPTGSNISDNGNTFNGPVSFAGPGAIYAANTFNGNVTFSQTAAISGNSAFNDSCILLGDGSITGSNSFNNLIFSPAYTYTLASGQTQTITGTLSANGTCGAFITIQSNTTMATTISHPIGAVTVNYVYLNYITATGGATFTANNAVNLGNNTGWGINPLTGGNLYWIGNGGNWSDGTHWSLTSGGVAVGCVPTSLDNVFFDSNSFSSGSQTVTIDLPTASCNNMDWRGVTNKPTLTATEPTNELNISGSLSFVPAMTVSNIGPVNFIATTTGQTVTSAGNSFSNTVTFNGIGGGWTLQDSMATNYYGIVLSNGSLNTNGQTVTTNSFRSASGTTRSLTAGASVFNINNVETAWYVTPVGMTMSAGSSVINLTDNDFSWSPTFTGGGFTYNILNFTGPLPTGSNISDNGNTFNGPVSFAGPGAIYAANTFNGNVTFSQTAAISGNSAFNDSCILLGDGSITGSNSFNNLIFSPAYTYTLASGQTQTITGTLSANGTCGAFITIQSNTTMATTISHPIGAVTVNYVYLNYITATGGATFTANNAVNLGNNTGWGINPLTGGNLYWIGNGGNWSDGTHWSLTSGGVAVGCVPTSLDNVFFDSNSFSSGSQTVTIDLPTASCNNMDWRGVTNKPTLTATEPTNELNISGSLSFVPAMTVSNIGPVNFIATTTGQTVTSAGNSFSNTVTFNGIGGGWTLQDSMATNYYGIVLSNGSLNTNGQTVTTNSFRSASGTTRSLTAGASVFNINNVETAWYVTPVGMTMSAGSSVINLTDNDFSWSPTFTGGGFTYNILNFTGPLPTGSNISDNGNTFNGPVSFAGPGAIYAANTFNGNVTFSQTAAISGNSAFNDSCILLGDGSITGSNSFNNLIFSPAYTYTLASGQTQTITGNLSISGNGSFPIRIKSSTPGSPATFSKASGMVCADYIRLSDNTATGGATFYAGANSQDLGGNTGWNFTGDGTAMVSVTSAPSGNVCPGTELQFTANAVNGGTMPGFQWLLNGSPVGSDSGTYSNNNFANGDVITCVLIGSAGVCTAAGADTARFTVSLYSAVGVSVSPTAAACNNTGSAIATVTTGTAPFKFLWNNGDTTQAISNLQAGAYNLTVTDKDGCSDTAGAVVNATGGAISLSVSSVNTSCGNNNGSVLANISAGTGPFAYSWNTGDTAQRISDLAAATYMLTVTGTGGCSATASAVVDSSTHAASPTITGNKTTICANDTAQLCAPAGYASYVWNTGSISPCASVNAAGNYYVTVTDENNCTAASNHLAVSVYPVPSVSIEVQGDTLSAYDAVSYQWYYDGNPVNGATSPDYIARQGGSYSVQITDTNGCHALSNDVTITGVTDLNEEASVKIFPNPSLAGNWQLSVDNSLMGSALEIYDDNGRLVFQSVIRSTQSGIDLKAAKGVYWLKIYSGSHIITRKLVEL